MCAGKSALTCLYQSMCVLNQINLSDKSKLCVLSEKRKLFRAQITIAENSNRNTQQKEEPSIIINWNNHNAGNNPYYAIFGHQFYIDTSFPHHVAYFRFCLFLSLVRLDYNIGVCAYACEFVKCCWFEILITRNSDRNYTNPFWQCETSYFMCTRYLSMRWDVHYTHTHCARTDECGKMTKTMRHWDFEKKQTNEVKTRKIVLNFTSLRNYFQLRINNRHFFCYVHRRMHRT